MPCAAKRKQTVFPFESYPNRMKARCQEPRSVQGEQHEINRIEPSDRISLYRIMNYDSAYFILPSTYSRADYAREADVANGKRWGDIIGQSRQLIFEIQIPFRSRHSPEPEAGKISLLQFLCLWRNSCANRDFGKTFYSSSFLLRAPVSL